MNWNNDLKDQDSLDSKQIQKLVLLAKQSMTIPGMTIKKALLHELRVSFPNLYHKLKKGECTKEFHQLINTLKF